MFEAAASGEDCHREEQPHKEGLLALSDVAIHGLLRSARNDVKQPVQPSGHEF